MPLATQQIVFDRRRVLRGGLALGLAGALPGIAGAQPAGMQGLLPYPASLSLIMNYLDRKSFPGGVVSIGRGTEEPDYVTAGTLAFDSAAETDENTLWRIYSMTKPVTGMAAMILIDEGKLKLDQPVADFIPAFAKVRVLVDPAKGLESQPAKNVMTIRHLLTHSSGLGYHFSVPDALKAEYLRLGLIPAQISRQDFGDDLILAPPVPLAPSLEAFADRLATVPLAAEPGTKWIYSVSLDLLGRIIELASGMALDGFLAKRMFEPLNMTSTFFRVPQARKAELATNYAMIGTELKPVDQGADSIYLDEPAFPFGGAGLVSTARDYDRFLAMLVGRGALGKTQIMSPQAATLGMSNLLPEGVSLDQEMGAGWGFGAGGRVGLNGVFKGFFGWAGAAGTVAWADTVRKVRGGGYANFIAPENRKFQEAVPQAVYKDLK